MPLAANDDAMELPEAIALIDHPYLHDPAAPKRWADLGAGRGLFSRALLRLLPPGGTLHMVDRAGPGDIGHPGAGLRVLRHTADFEHDPPNTWAHGPLDGVLMANSLHYVADKGAFLALLTSLLVPHGVLLVVEYDTEIPVSRWVPYPMSQARAVGLMRGAGFTGVARIGGRPSAFGHAPLYSVIGRLGLRRP